MEMLPHVVGPEHLESKAGSTGQLLGDDFCVWSPFRWARRESAMGLE